MGTRVPAVLDKIIALASATVPSTCSVVDGYAGATAFGNVLTIGVPDEGLATVGALTTPAVTIQRSDPIGSSDAQVERLQVLCSLEVPAGSVDDTTPATVRTDAAEVVDALAAAVSARGALDDDTQPVVGWLTENAWYQGDMPAGHGVMVLLTIYVESYV